MPNPVTALLSKVFGTREKKVLVEQPEPAFLLAEVSEKSLAPQTLKKEKSLRRLYPNQVDELARAYIHDPIVFNAINKIVQTIMSAGYVLKCKDENVLKWFEEFLSQIGNRGGETTWEEILTRIFQDLCVFGNAWVELIYNKAGNEILDLDIVDATTMDYAKSSDGKIVLDENGSPVGYVQRLPLDVNVSGKGDPKPARVHCASNEIFLLRKRICHFKLYVIGDGFYGIGLIEPTYLSIVRKMNIEEALANSIWAQGFAPRIVYCGDKEHPPTPSAMNAIVEGLKELSYKQNLAIPYYNKIELLEPKRIEEAKSIIEYYRELVIAGLGIPKPFATGGGEETNRATLTNQQRMFELTLTDIVNRTCSTIRKYIFKRICDLKGFKEVPQIVWNKIGEAELNDKTSRLATYLKYGCLDPKDESLQRYIKRSENLE